jgi:hypothetical protein
MHEITITNKIQQIETTFIPMYDSSLHIPLSCYGSNKCVITYTVNKMIRTHTNDVCRSPKTWVARSKNLARMLRTITCKFTNQ